MDEYFDIKIDPIQYLFVSTKTQIYLCSPDIKKVMPHLHAEKFGIPILKIDRDQYRPTHYVGNILGHLATKNIIEMNDEQMQSYVSSKTLTLEELDVIYEKKTFPYRLIKRNGYGMSMTKIV